MAGYSKEAILQELKAAPDTTQMTIAKAALPWLQAAEEGNLALGTDPRLGVRVGSFLVDSLLGNLPTIAKRVASGEGGVLAQSAPTMRGGSMNPLNYRMTPEGAEVASWAAPAVASRAPVAARMLRDLPGEMMDAAAQTSAAGVVNMAGRSQRKKAPKAVASVFDGVTDADQALAMARRGEHLKIDPKTGKYIGAPAIVDSPQALGAVRRNADEMVRDGAYNADWYLRQRELAEDLTDSVPMQSVFARGTSAYSPQAMPKVELPTFTRQHNAKVLNNEDVVARTGSQMRNVAKAYEIDPATGAVTFRPEAIRLGKKTGPYADAKDPTIPEASLYRTANDIWHGRVMGYGDDFSRGFTPQEHGYLTGENLLLADRANAAGIPLGGHPAGTPWSPRSAQAATWGSTRYRALEAEEAKKFLAAQKLRERYESNPERWRKKHKSAPPIPKDPRTPDELRAYASQGLDTAFPNQSFNLTNEAVTGAGTGHLAGLHTAPQGERLAYTDAILKATGRDPALESWGMFAGRPRATEGAYPNTQGFMEHNPGWAEPVLVSNVQGPMGIQTPQNEMDALNAAVKIGAVMRGQEAGAASRFIPRGSTGLRVRDMNALRFPNATPGEITSAMDAAGLPSPTVMDYGNSRVVADFDAPTAKKMATALKNAPLQAEMGRAEGVYEPGLAKWEGKKLVPTAPGSGEATTAMLKAIDNSGVFKAYERLDAGRWPDTAKAYNEIDKAISQATSRPLREDLMRLREIIATSGFSGLRDFVRQHGAAGLPALAALGILPGGGTEPDAN